MLTYKYKRLKSDSLINESQLNEFSVNGWELISIVSFEEEFYFYFKKFKKIL